MDYLQSVLDTKDLAESRMRLLIRFLEEKIDYRTLTKMRNHFYDKFPKNREITLEEWKAESHKYLHIYPKDIEEKLLLEITSNNGQTILKEELSDLLDSYQHLPIKLKRDKNKSENVYFILNSNQRGGFQSKE